MDGDSIELAKSLMEKARKLGVKMLLPIDVVAADEFSADAKTVTVPVEGFRMATWLWISGFPPA